MKTPTFILLAIAILLIRADCEEAKAPATPALTDKLALIDLRVSQYAITYTSNNNGLHEFSCRWYEAGRLWSAIAAIPAGKGGKSVFPDEGPAKGRFQLIRVEERFIQNPLTEIFSLRRFAVIKDLNPLRMGEVFEVCQGGGGRVVRKDYKAIFGFDTENATRLEFEVKQGGSFRLPPDPGASNRPFKFVRAGQDGSVILHHSTVDGTKKIRLQPRRNGT